MAEEKKFKEASEKATEILEKISYYGSDEKVVSTDAVISAIEKEHNLKINVYGMDFSDMSGDLGEYGAIMETEGQNVNIYLNTEKEPMFQRFSLAHELGHLVCEKIFNTSGKRNVVLSTHIDYKITSYPEEDYTSSDDLLKEQAANVFALKLLMPEKQLKAVANKYKISSIIGEYFGVSKDAVNSALTLKI